MPPESAAAGHQRRVINSLPSCLRGSHACLDLVSKFLCGHIKIHEIVPSFSCHLCGSASAHTSVASDQSCEITLVQSTVITDTFKRSQVPRTPQQPGLPQATAPSKRWILLDAPGEDAGYSITQLLYQETGTRRGHLKLTCGILQGHSKDGGRRQRARRTRDRTATDGERE